MTIRTVAVPDDLNEFIDNAVKSGHFAGANELMASALYVYRDQMALDEIKLRRLRRDVQTGMDQIDRGEVVTDWNVENFLAEMKSKRQQTHAEA